MLLGTCLTISAILSLAASHSVLPSKTLPTKTVNPRDDPALPLGTDFESGPEQASANTATKGGPTGLTL